MPTGSRPAWSAQASLSIPFIGYHSALSVHLWAALGPELSRVYAYLASILITVLSKNDSESYRSNLDNQGHHRQTVCVNKRQPWERPTVKGGAAQGVDGRTAREPAAGSSVSSSTTLPWDKVVLGSLSGRRWTLDGAQLADVTTCSRPRWSAVALRSSLGPIRAQPPRRG